MGRLRRECRPMDSSKNNVEKLAILNAWVTSIIVILNLLTAFVVVNVRTFESLATVVFVSGTVGGAASNYRRLQEAYVQQLGKAKHEWYSIQVSDEAGEHSRHHQEEELEVSSDRPDESEIADSPSIQRSATKSLALKNRETLLLLRLQIFLSPLFGGLFAFVLYGVFASGIIQGEIFPRFQSVENEYSTPQEFADQVVPATNEDAAKAILWAFIAGFAEGFVPNFIDKLVKDAEQDESS